MRRVLAVGFLALLVLSACHITDRYSPVQASEWPHLDGVVVMSSKGFAGNSCCEAHPGSRDLVVQVTDAGGSALATLQQRLIAAGWFAVRCTGPAPRSKELCSRGNGLFADLRAPHSDHKADQGIVLVDVERTF